MELVRKNLERQVSKDAHDTVVQVRDNKHDPIVYEVD